MVKRDFSRLIKLEKDSEVELLVIPITGLLKHFKLKGKFNSKEKFDNIISRTGHINQNKLTIILNSKS